MDLEFKRGARQGLNDNDIVQAVVCMANGQGGLLLLGVEDDGRITGLQARHGDRSDPAQLRAMVQNRTDPPVVTEIEILGDHPVSLSSVKS